jgi:hypothetical protein
MATAQVVADQKKAGMLGERDAGGFVYTAIGGIHHYTGQGAPTHAAVKGSVYMDTSAANMYICVTADTATAAAWKLVTRAS